MIMLNPSSTVFPNIQCRIKEIGTCLRIERVPSGYVLSFPGRAETPRKDFAEFFSQLFNPSSEARAFRRAFDSEMAVIKTFYFVFDLVNPRRKQCQLIIPVNR